MFINNLIDYLDLQCIVSAMCSNLEAADASCDEHKAST